MKLRHLVLGVLAVVLVLVAFGINKPTISMVPQDPALESLLYLTGDWETVVETGNQPIYTFHNGTAVFSVKSFSVKQSLSHYDFELKDGEAILIEIDNSGMQITINPSFQITQSSTSQ